METAHPVQCHIHMKKVLLQDIGSMETVHPVHITQNTDIHTKPRKGHELFVFYREGTRSFREGMRSLREGTRSFRVPSP